MFLFSKKFSFYVRAIFQRQHCIVSLLQLQNAKHGFTNPGQEYHINQKTFSRDELLATHSRLAPQIISQLQASSKFTTYFMLGNDELVSKYTPEIMKIYRQMHKEGLEKGLTQVIASEISFAKLSDNNVESSGGLQ